ncbi:MAG: DNA primase, partial [Myxococcota bacterium]
QAFFVEHGKNNSDAQAYLKHRGLQPHIIEQFALGFAPDQWGALKQHLLQHGHDLEQACAVGLLKKSEQSQRLYDRFRHRLMFPIHDPSGQVVGFGGRALRELDGAKYINSPESPLFQKSQLLYGLHQAHASIRKNEYAILVEGYMDVLSLHQYGFTSAIATMGTSLTPTHCTLLKRYTSQIVLLFDSDSAGQRANDRALSLLLPAGFSVSTLSLPKGSDPDSFLREHGSEAFQHTLQQKQPAFEQWLQRILQQHQSDPVALRQATEPVLHLLHTIQDPILQDLYLQKTSQRLRLEESLLRRQMMHLIVPKTSTEQLKPKPNATPEHIHTQRQRQETLIARVLLKSWIDQPDVLQTHSPVPLLHSIQSPLWRPILEQFVWEHEEGGDQATLIANAIQALQTFPAQQKQLQDALFKEAPFTLEAIQESLQLITHLFHERQRKQDAAQHQAELVLIQRNPSPTTPSKSIHNDLMQSLSPEEHAWLQKAQQLAQQRLKGPLARFLKPNGLLNETKQQENPPDQSRQSQRKLDT